jgi:catechol 2,3-dioxygenase-like lactoylglutathione lyase family enzyme
LQDARITHLGICVSDLEASRAFYRDALGFEPLRELEASGRETETLLELPGAALRAVYLRKDGVVVELLGYDHPGSVGDGSPRPMNALGLTHLSLRVPDLAAAIETLESQGVNVLRHTRIHNPELDAKAVFVTDPDGTRIELVESRSP